MSKKSGFKIWGPTYGYEREKGAHVFSFGYDGNDDKTRKLILLEIKKAEEKYNVKISIMGVGENVQGPLRSMAQQYIQPEWKVPPNQIHFAFPAGEIIKPGSAGKIEKIVDKLDEEYGSPEGLKKAIDDEYSVDDPPASKPASPPPTSKQAQAKPATKGEDTVVIQTDLWDMLKKIGG